MKCFRYIVFPLLALLCLNLAAAAQTPIRAYVSTNGNDAALCTLSAPCQSLQRGVVAAGAGGEVVVLESGEYQGATPLTITQSVSILVPPGLNAVVKVSSGAAVTIAAGSADKVYLRGLSLLAVNPNDGNGNDSAGIKATSVGTLQVENCVISGFLGQGIDVETAADSKLFVRDSEIRNVLGKGIDLSTGSGTVKAYIDRTRIERNGSEGVYIGDNVQAHLRRCLITGSEIGLHVSPTAASVTALVTAEQCEVTSNNYGLKSDGAGLSTTRVSNSVVTRNATGLVPTPSTGAILSRLNNTLATNASDGTFSGSYAAQ